MANSNTGKKSITGNIIWVIVTGIILVIYAVTSLPALLAKPKDINDVIAEEGTPEKGQYVTIGVDAVVDWYAETEYKINGVIPAGTKRHCIVWVNDTTFISMTVRGDKNYGIIDDIIDDTWAYLGYETTSLPSPTEFSGKITSIDSDVSSYYSQGLSAYGIYSSDGLTILQLDIDTTNGKGMGFLILGVIVLLFVGGIVFMIKDIRHNKKVASMPPAMTYNAPSSDPVFGNMMQANEQAQATSTMTDDNNNLYS